MLIIGAGYSGLAAGIYARLNGYDVKILERQKNPGGVAAVWKRGDFICDGGVHFFMNYTPDSPIGELYRALGLDQDDQYIPLEDYGCFLDPASGKKVTVSKNLDRLGEDLKKLSPNDSGFIDSFVKACRDFQGLDLFAGMAKPPEMTGWCDKARIMINSRRVYPYFSGRWQLPVKTAAAGLHNSFLKGIINNIFLPDVPLWFPASLLGMLADGDLALRRDGSAGFARAMEKRYLELGGQIEYGAEISEIVTERDEVKGAVLASGEVVKADRVISSGDISHTMFKLLKGEYLHPDVMEAYEKWPLNPPSVIVHLGLDMDLSDQETMIIYRPEKRITRGFPDSNWLVIRNFNFSPLFSPPGQSIIQVMMGTRWDPWRRLREDRQAYREEKAEMAGQIIQSLDCLHPGLSNSVKMVDAATPYTMWRYTLNRQGSYLGFALTSSSVNASIPRTAPGLSGFYQAGQWTSPGGGVISALMSGRHAIMLLCRDDNRKFKAGRQTKETSPPLL